DILKAGGDVQAIAEVRNDLDGVTAELVFVTLDEEAVIDIGPAEQLEVVEGLGVAEVTDARLLAGHDDGGIADRHIGFVDVEGLGVDVEGPAGAGRRTAAGFDVAFVDDARLADGLQLDGGAGRTEVAVGGANELEPGLNLGVPVGVLAGRNTGIRAGASGAGTRPHGVHDTKRGEGNRTIAEGRTGVGAGADGVVTVVAPREFVL